MPFSGTHWWTRSDIGLCGELCWLHKDALIKRLDAALTAESDDAAALTHEMRQQQEAEVQGDLLAVERDEAALMFKAWAEGLPVMPRADIDPVAVLAVELVNAPAVNEQRGSTPGWSFGLRR